MNNLPSRGDLNGNFPEHDVELLDRVLQNLFGLGLKLEYCLSVLDDAPAQARSGMEGVLTGLDEMAEPIRDEIHRRSGSRKLSQETPY
jgi:hypothetical protein